jgi:hypothetical protein
MRHCFSGNKISQPAVDDHASVQPKASPSLTNVPRNPIAQQSTITHYHYAQYVASHNSGKPQLNTSNTSNNACTTPIPDRRPFLSSFLGPRFPRTQIREKGDQIRPIFRNQATHCGKRKQQNLTNSSPPNLDTKQIRKKKGKTTRERPLSSKLLPKRLSMRSAYVFIPVLY